MYICNTIVTTTQTQTLENTCINQFTKTCLEIVSVKQTEQTFDCQFENKSTNSYGGNIFGKTMGGVRGVVPQIPTNAERGCAPIIRVP